MMTLTLASQSATRLRMLAAAGIPVVASPVRLDEDALRISLARDGATPRDIADGLAEMKARKCADRAPGQLVLGCDQVLEYENAAWSKPDTLDEARRQLMILRGRSHRLWSAAVVYHLGRPIWRHIGEARMTMRHFSNDYLEDYLGRHWPDVSGSVGAYRIEDEGARLFSDISGDHFTILGLPLIPLLACLSDRGFIAA